tara:strand:+ start:190 stop:813 length:624 start_codon:yes stop_codon:yes gene_type:complete
MKRIIYIVFIFLILYCKNNSINEVQDIFGCTDPEACNYNPSANILDNSCFYQNDLCECYDMNCLGCTDENAINYNLNSSQNDGSCIWSYEITQNQSFYFIENILDSLGNQIIIEDFYLGTFKDDICIGNRQWNNGVTDVPAMGNSTNSINYLNIGDIPSFRLYDIVGNKEYLLSFDGICYDVNHNNIINCGFINNGIYYISSLNLIY